MDRFPFRDLFFRGTNRPPVMTRESVIGLVFFHRRLRGRRRGHFLLITFLLLFFNSPSIIPQLKPIIDR